jgi:beta-phosphoglucomutase family hydrolase
VPAPSLAAIFDMDGVLADTAQAHFESWQVIARRTGVEVTWADFEQTFGRPNHQIIPELLHRDVPADELREIDRVKEAEFRRIVSGALEPLPGVCELIAALDASGFGLAVGSSGPRENIDAILSALGLAGHFPTIVSAWDVQLGKPHPEVFLKAADRIAVEPGRCCVFEDVPAGIRAAKAAGMKCIAVTTTHPAASLAEADVVVDTLEGITPGDVAALIG